MSEGTGDETVGTGSLLPARERGGRFSKIPRAEQLDKERQALELRRAGIDYQTIAERLGYANKGGAHKAVRRALNRNLAVPASELRDLEADRLDRLQASLWRNALAGDLHAVDRVIRLSESRRKLLGLDAPSQVQAELAGDLILNFGIPRPDPRVADAAAVSESSLRALP